MHLGQEGEGSLGKVLMPDGSPAANIPYDVISGGFSTHVGETDSQGRLVDRKGVVEGDDPFTVNIAFSLPNGKDYVGGGRGNVSTLYGTKSKQIVITLREVKGLSKPESSEKKKFTWVASAAVVIGLMVTWMMVDAYRKKR